MEASYGMSRSISVKFSTFYDSPDMTNLSFDYDTFAMVIIASDGLWDTRTNEQAALLSGTNAERVQELCMLLGRRRIPAKQWTIFLSSLLV